MKNPERHVARGREDERHTYVNCQDMYDGSMILSS